MQVVWRSKWARISLAACLTAWTSTFGIASLDGPVLAARPGAALVDVQSESDMVVQGGKVVLTALVFDESRALFSGPHTSTQVRFFFMQGSPNDIASRGNSPDLACDTGELGECSVTYVAAKLGTDDICALIGGSPTQCVEPADSPDLDNGVDIVERTIVKALPASPAATLTPAPAPTGAPTPSPTRTPTPTPTSTPAAAPTPTPLSPTLTKSPTRTAMPKLPPTPSPTSIPTPTPAGEAAADPQSSPSPKTFVPAAQALPAETGPDSPVGPVEAVGRLVSETVFEAGKGVKPEVAAVVTTFGFPLGLAAAVLAFMVLQSRLDHRDPKLREAPQTNRELMVPFEGDDET